MDEEHEREIREEDRQADIDIMDNLYAAYDFNFGNEEKEE